MIVVKMSSKVTSSSLPQPSSSNPIHKRFRDQRVSLRIFILILKMVSTSTTILFGWRVDNEKLRQWAFDNKVGTCKNVSLHLGPANSLDEQCLCANIDVCWEHMNDEQEFVAVRPGLGIHPKREVYLVLAYGYGPITLDPLEEMMKNDERVARHVKLAKELGATHEQPRIYAATEIFS